MRKPDYSDIQHVLNTKQKKLNIMEKTIKKNKKNEHFLKYKLKINET